MLCLCCVRVCVCVCVCGFVFVCVCVFGFGLLLVFVLMFVFMLCLCLCLGWGLGWGWGWGWELWPLGALENTGTTQCVCLRYPGRCRCMPPSFPVRLRAHSWPSFPPSLPPLCSPLFHVQTEIFYSASAKGWVWGRGGGGGGGCFVFFVLGLLFLWTTKGRFRPAFCRFIGFLRLYSEATGGIVSNVLTTSCLSVCLSVSHGCTTLMSPSIPLNPPDVLRLASHHRRARAPPPISEVRHNTPPAPSNP